MTAREEILARIRTALSDVPADETPDDVPVPRKYQASHATGDVLDLFSQRVEDYRATVIRTSAADLPEQIADALARRGARRVVVPEGFPLHWLLASERPDGWSAEWLRDDPPLTLTELDRAEAVLTTAAVGIAVTGTIVLNAGPGQGRRALSLVPDYHLCVIQAEQIAPDLPAALAALAQPTEPAKPGNGTTRPLTFISGPSATSDIELNRVEGVHGPRTLDVIVVDDTTPTNGEN
jgi:L-lactate dehydrogenase complex protein LldG